MQKVLAIVQVRDFDRFWENFRSRGALMRSSFGSHGAVVYRDDAQAERVYILFDWESRTRMDEFFDDPIVRETMEAGGVVGFPEFRMITEHATLPS